MASIRVTFSVPKFNVGFRYRNDGARSGHLRVSGATDQPALDPINEFPEERAWGFHQQSTGGISGSESWGRAEGWHGRGGARKYVQAAVLEVVQH